MDSKPRAVRIIWITPRALLGTPDGARVASQALICNLSRLGVGIDAICLAPQNDNADAAEAVKQLGLQSCKVIPRSRSILKRFPSLMTPFTFRSFTDIALQEKLRAEIASLLKDPTSAPHVWILFDGLHPFAAFSELDFRAFSKKCRGTIYRAHNVETVLWEQCAKRAKMPWARWFFQYQAALVRQVEGRAIRRVNLIAPVSEDDAARFANLAPNARIAVTPIGMDFPDEAEIKPVPDSKNFELLFVGRLDWLPNRDGLSWFLANVWPRLTAQRPDVHLTIAGVGDSCWLEQFRNLKGIDFLGKVEDIAPLYWKSALSIAPLFQGSGTRVKILEAARYGKAVMTTDLGAEGTGLIPDKSYFRAENQLEWLNLLSTITKEDCHRVGFSAFRSIRKSFDAVKIAAQFLKTLETISQAKYPERQVQQ